MTLDTLDLDRIAPGSEDDPEIARSDATIRALKERNGHGAASEHREGAATNGDTPVQPARPPAAIDPRELPDVRAALVDHLDAPSTADWWRQSEGPGETFQRAALQPHMSVDQIRLAERDRLARATLFTVSPEMMELVLEAAPSLPECRIHPNDVPAPIGLCYYPTPIAHVEPGDLPLSAISWSTNDAGIFMSWYVSEMFVLEDRTGGNEPPTMSRTTPPHGLWYYGETELPWREGESFTLRGDGGLSSTSRYGVRRGMEPRTGIRRPDHLTPPAWWGQLRLSPNGVVRNPMPVLGSDTPAAPLQRDSLGATPGT
jgi:hypothetical protein